MSKQRPSSGAAAGMTPAAAIRRGLARASLPRVFHNTYTRRGRPVALGGWSTKIQYQGRRRTVPLKSRTKAAALAEAQGIRDRIMTEGWDTVLRQYAPRQDGAFPKTDARYWQERLLLRNYPVLPGRHHELSTRIEHAGASDYFPLGLSEPRAAALRALAIYRTILDRGWETARRVFPREVTIAFHWACNPLLWTYTTLHTLTGERLAPAAERREQASPPKRALLVEADSGIRNSLQRYLNQHHNCLCVAHADPDSARRHNASRGTALCLVNRDLAECMGLSNFAQLGALANGVPVLTYGVHLDSEELFALTPGGRSGYVLKRLPPEHILEPVLRLLDRGRVPAESLLHGAQSYFRRLLQSGPTGQASCKTAQLTKREQDVMSLMSKGYVDKQIAPALGISTWTVHEHVKSIFEKTQVHSRTEAVLAYLQK